MLSLGTGASSRLAVCPVDEPGYVVGQVRADGYLTLRRSPGSVVRVRETRSSRASGSPSGLARARCLVWWRCDRSISPAGRDPAARRFTVDSALVDVGAASETEAAAHWGCSRWPRSPCTSGPTATAGAAGRTDGSAAAPRARHWWRRRGEPRRSRAYRAGGVDGDRFRGGTPSLVPRAGYHRQLDGTFRGDLAAG